MLSLKSYLMGADNVIISGSNLVTVVSNYQNSMAGYPSFSAIAASGSGLIANTDIPNSTLSKRTSGMYNNCWQVKTGWPAPTEHSFCKMFRAFYNGNVLPPTATQPTTNAITATPDQYNNSSIAGTYFGVGLWYKRYRYYFGLQVNDTSKGTARITSPWFVGPSSGGRQAYLTSIGGSGTISGIRNGNVAGGSTNSYNSGAVGVDYIQLDAFVSYPNIFSAWRANSVTGTVLSTNASFNLYYDNVNMKDLTTLHCIFKA